MISLNLREKMIGCFCIHLLFYIVVGVTFLKDFDLFKDDVTLLMHAGDLSNICLEIRRYEKNYIIRHADEDFRTVIQYINKAQHTVPQVVEDLKIMPHPRPLQDLCGALREYKKNFIDMKENCTHDKKAGDCACQVRVRELGHRLVTITEGLVEFEKREMNLFMERFMSRLGKVIVFLVILSLFTITLLYTAIIKPLKKVEIAAIEIANGTFSQVPVDEKKGEVRSVLRAFNGMVKELEERQEQLFQAKKLSSIGTLASGTAHQINNPLNNIATSCQLALTEIDPEKSPLVARMLETINQETERAGEIVRGLLEFSRSQTFSLQRYSLAEVISKVRKLVAGEIPAGIQLKTDIPQDIMLLIDVQKMVEALLNLCINAIQSIEKPSGTVFIIAEKDLEEKMAIIMITDTGAGIEKENLPKIFDPFFTTKNVDHGTGLGLAVVYGIIKKQNGLIRVESEKGEGTRFIISLPLHMEPETVPFSAKS